MKNPTERGNALFMILIAIFLLGGITALITRTSGTTDDTGSSEKAMITASKILRSAAGLEAGYQQLLSRGCSENQVSFWTDTNGDGNETAADTYYNANAPTDKSCHIFDAKGAGLTKRIQADDFTVAAIYNVGTSAPDMYYGISYEIQGGTRGLSNELCRALNKTLDNGFTIGSLPEADMTPGGPFTGSFVSALIFGDNGTEAGMNRVKAGCVVDNGCTGAPSNKCNMFYAVVIKR